MPCCLKNLKPNYPKHQSQYITTFYWQGIDLEKEENIPSYSDRIFIPFVLHQFNHIEAVTSKSFCDTENELLFSKEW